MSDVVRVDIQDQVARVEINNPPVNATGQAVRQGLLDAVAQIEQAGANAAIVYGAGRTFVAGGDISEFGKPPQLPHLPDVYQAIEDSSVPWIAAVHGTTLGGGFELAMACAFRLAQKGTRFGLPEVNLGLVPGAGGSQRLPRLIGVDAAIDLATTGKMIDADELQELGGLDGIFEGDPLEAGLAFAADLPARPTKVSARDVAPVGSDYFAQKHAEIKKRAKGQSSPLDNLKAIEWAATLPFTEGQPKERQLHLDLRDSTQSQALRHVFFAERAVSKPKAIEGGTPIEINTICVVGGGLMGAGIAFACLQAGYRVILIERDDDAAKAGQDRIAGLIEGGIKRGKISDEKAVKLRSALSVSSDYAASASADLAIEAVFEDLAVKQAVFQSLAAHMRNDAILATNTSYLDPTDIFQGIQNPARFIGLHFFSPAHIMKLLEIVKLPTTSKDVLATGFDLGKRLRKVGVLSGICDGFIGNRILSAYRRQADYLLMDGCTPRQIDRAMRDFGMPMGPYELQDLTGLQIAWANRKRQAATRPAEERYVRIGDLLCEAERFGQRSQKGWYQYEEGDRTPQDDPFVTDLITEEAARAGVTRRDFTDQDIVDRLMAVMINEGALIVEEGVAERDLDVDLVKIHGYGFPRWRGGPMHYGEQIGIDKVKQAMADVAAQSPNSWRVAGRLS
ncbi:3-hydroxyacyl-CoA dehydrogenase [Maritalea myrionectae]|uniref:3-hydroxyacyl-CoA dehydrogenase n=1 Tax=Maritalea myrionectae TaxID=454601 RepID=A0A2R4MI22_9HYPH|nr:FAD-dependent oxidoreductase [Maritalea myrionectae]AVX05675.1 3-hydroxyacyl-CoA dehydrogenase [Maritalea myrionectae]